MENLNFEKNMLKMMFLLFLLLSFSRLLFATTPNPGHSWAEVGDGTFQVSGPSTMRTYTFPDADSTILSSNSTVTVGQGGTGATTLTGILKGNGTSPFTAVTAPSGALVGDTDTQTLTNKTIAYGSNTLTGVAGSGANSDITSLSALSTALTVGQGGTGLSTLTANSLLVGNGTSALSFLAPGTSGNILQSNGTSWESAAGAGGGSGELIAMTSRNYVTNGSVASQQNNSLTDRRASLFFVPQSITINQLSYYVAAVTTAGTYKVCLYTEDGSTKVMDVTSGTNTSALNSVTVSPAVTLAPGNYYLVFGCATTCNNTVTSLSNISILHLNGGAVPSGTNVFTGTVTHSSGVCDSTLGTVSPDTTATPLIRFDN